MQLLHPLKAASQIVLAVALAAIPMWLEAAQTDILLPLNRTAYQTNEWIDLAVARGSSDNLAAGDLILEVRGDDGSHLKFTFSVPEAEVIGAEARCTEHLHLNGRLLRPGRYEIAVAVDGATAATEIDVCSHLRRSSFRLINWGRATGQHQLVEGEDSLGFNLFYGHYGRDDEANFIRAGVDFMSCCTMGGGHQMDLRSECDWSDPYVTRGGTRRVTHRALIDRTRPNVFGVHFYDEPGLTWHNHPTTGEWTPHGLPSQVRAYESAFGHKPIPYHKVDPDNPDHVARWRHWALWKLGFMDAAWKEAQFGVSYVRGDYVSVTQSQYGFSAFTDGYYFNVARSLPIVSGHGGYDDYGCGYFNPSYFLEIARARDFAKPCWYLPSWYGNTPSDRFRLEQYLSFMTNIQGMITPPDIDPFEPATKPATEGVVEAHKLMGRLGTIFTTMPVTRPPVAMLYSLSHNVHVQTGDMQANYVHSNNQGRRLPLTCLAGKILQRQFMAVVEEDVVDGTLAAHHKAIVLTSIDYLDPKVVTALEAFAATGALVMLTGDCRVRIEGAVDLGVVADLPDAELVARLHAEGKHTEAGPYETVGHLLRGATPLAEAIKVHLDRAGIRPIFSSDVPSIVATRQALGDVEYLFAVNATYDAETGGRNAIRPVEATLGLAADGRPVYDAVRGGPVAELQPQGDVLSGRFRFGPGQMRVFARTTRPIGSVQAMRPILSCDYTREEAPLAVDIGGVVLDDRGQMLTGSIPLRVRLIDALGKTRYDLHRATDQGTLRLRLLLAANDPAGEWKVVVAELLSDTEDVSSFQFVPPAQCGAMAGRTARAVSFAGDRDNVFRFFRVHHDVTIAIGSSDYHAAAAQRLSKILRPWGVRCRVINAADVNRPRTLSEEEAATWVGLDFGRAKPGAENPVARAGFDVEGPVVLLGNSDDNPMVRFLQEQRFRPYQPDATSFPGRGRGMLAWQRDALGPGQESITLIGYDAEGMSEAVGTLYEAMAGIEPLTRFVPPQANTIQSVPEVEVAEQAEQAWQVILPDRAVAMNVSTDGRLQALTWDGTLVQVDPTGRIVARRTVEAAELANLTQRMKSTSEPGAVELAEKHPQPGRIPKTAATGGDLVAVAYWGGALRIVNSAGEVLSSQLLPQDVTGLAWLEETLVVGLADGRLIALRVR